MADALVFSTWRRPEPGLSEIGAWGRRCLESLVAIDSQSDERSESIPSTEGQRVLAEHVERLAADWGWRTEIDDHANLIVTVPARAAAGGRSRPKLALMTHLDTARGTEATERLYEVPAWGGQPIRYPENPRLVVDVTRYEATRAFLGERLLHGPGLRPIGLDNKLGMAEVLTLAWLLATHADVEHGELLLVFRPDEEIGRMRAVEGLAERLAACGVRRGYTIDGFEPFEINTENFDAAAAEVCFRPFGALEEASCKKVLRFRVCGAKSHGACAKAEGYRNAVCLLAEALEPWLVSERGAVERGVVSVSRFETDPSQETDAAIELLLGAPDSSALLRLEQEVRGRTDRAIGPHAFKGATLEWHDPGTSGSWPVRRSAFDAALRFVHALLLPGGPEPVLSERSAGRQGYTNPYAIEPVAEGEGFQARLRFRVRDFGDEALSLRTRHLERLSERSEAVCRFACERQYVNMGPRLAAAPELVEWAERAAVAIGVEAKCSPIRGGTGVDPFIERGVLIANLGTGYFGPESEKEFTSVEMLARHALWLFALVQGV